MPPKRFTTIKITITITKKSHSPGNWHIVIATDKHAHTLTAASANTVISPIKCHSTHTYISVYVINKECSNASCFLRVCVIM